MSTVILGFANQRMTSPNRWRVYSEEDLGLRILRGEWRRFHSLWPHVESCEMSYGDHIFWVLVAGGHGPHLCGWFN